MLHSSLDLNQSCVCNKCNCVCNNFDHIKWSKLPTWLIWESFVLPYRQVSNLWSKSKSDIVSA